MIHLVVPDSDLLIIDELRDLTFLTYHNKVTVIRVPGHSRLKNNEKAVGHPRIGPGPTLE